MAGLWSRVRAFLSSPAPDYARIWAETESRVAAFRREAWKPVCEAESDGGRQSRFGGAPLLAPGSDWPACGRCARKLPFLLQVAAAELPEAARDRFPKGLLQLFFCTRCFRWEPFTNATLVRVLPSADELEAAPETAGAQPFPLRAIVGWERAGDYEIPGDDGAAECELDDLQIDSMYEAGYPLQGDKLFGTPYWVQDPDPPPCSRCSRPMAHLIQIDSNENLDLMWGDAGVAHVFWCSDHQDVLALVWQCH
jgi:uncharacterized protein YwqG